MANGPILTYPQVQQGTVEPVFFVRETYYNHPHPSYWCQDTSLPCLNFLIKTPSTIKDICSAPKIDFLPLVNSHTRPPTGTVPYPKHSDWHTYGGPFTRPWWTNKLKGSPQCRTLRELASLYSLTLPAQDIHRQEKTTQTHDAHHDHDEHPDQLLQTSR